MCLHLIHDRLPAKAKSFTKQTVFYEQNRPKFRATFYYDGHTFPFWCLFDTGRDGKMLIGEDFTGQNRNRYKSGISEDVEKINLRMPCFVETCTRNIRVTGGFDQTMHIP